MPVPLLHSSLSCFILSGGNLQVMMQKLVPSLVQNFGARGFLLVFLFALLTPEFTGAQQPALNLMPTPESEQPGTGSLRVDSSFSVALTGHTEPRLERGVERFLTQLQRQTALLLNLKPVKSAQATFVLQTDHASKEIQEVGEDESYVLQVTSSGAKLTAATPLGALHGLQTFLQLVDV